MNSRISKLLAAGTLAALLVACESTPEPVPTPTIEPEPTSTPVPKGQIFKIYSSLPLSGENAAQATEIANAINLAIEKQTDGGTLCDGVLKIVYESLDDAVNGSWDTMREQEIAYQVNADADAMAFIGPLDAGAARVSVPILNQGSVAMISPGADGVGLTRAYAPSDPLVYYPTGKRNFMRLVPPLDVQGRAAATWAKTLGATKAFIVDDAEQYGRGPSDAFVETAGQVGIQVVGRERMDDTASNIKDIASKIKSTGADLLFFGGESAQHAASLYEAIMTAGVTARFMGTQAIVTPAFVETAGDGSAYATSAGISQDRLSAKGQQFLKDYAARFNSQPEMSALYGYEAASVVLAAAQKVCQKDRVALLDAMYGVQDFDGVLGRWSFDANGDTSLMALKGVSVIEGRWADVLSIDLP